MTDYNMGNQHFKRRFMT